MKKAHNLYYYNRELSWLSFNERVLQEAQNQNFPLLERLKFLMIYQSNLVEFFMVRVGALADRNLVSKDSRDDKTGLTPRCQIQAICSCLVPLQKKADAIYSELLSLLKQQKLNIIKVLDLDQQTKQKLINDFCKKELFSLQKSVVITQKGQRLPFFKNKTIYIVALLASCANINSRVFGVVPVPIDKTKRLVFAGLDSQNNKTYVLYEDLCLSILGVIFPKYQIKASIVFRMTRSADIDSFKFYDEGFDYKHQVEKLVQMRKRLFPVCLKFQNGTTQDTKDQDTKALVARIKGKRKTLLTCQVFYTQSPLDYSFLSCACDLICDEKLAKSLQFAKLHPKKYGINVDTDMLSMLEKKDMLLFYPYDSFEIFLQLLLNAATSPKVKNIKMTLYRLAKDSMVVKALCIAAKNGKKVDVLIELRARFDEENNIEQSEQLEKAGCNVIYGLPKLKTHSKLCLITMQTAGKLQYITQIGTGNYNEQTAKLYTDLSLFTSRATIGLEAEMIFQALLHHKVPTSSRELLVSPKGLLTPVLQFMQEEIIKATRGQKAYIGIKINSLTDKKIIDKLLEASVAGVKVDLIIRGICCLRLFDPTTKNITVRSIVGRFLEHSRIYIFGGQGQEHIFISSADFMTRNTQHRVEIACPVLQETLKTKIKNIFSSLLKDDTQASQLQKDAQYLKLNGNTFCAQQWFINEK